MFTLDGAIEDRRARMVMMAHSKATLVLFRTSYHGRPGTSVFNRSIEGEYGHLKLGSYIIYFPKGNIIVLFLSKMEAHKRPQARFLPIYPIWRKIRGPGREGGCP